MDQPNIEGIKALSRALNRPIETLIVSVNGDPFYVKPSFRKAAEWFAELWERFGFRRGAHLRRIHYRLVSQATPIFGPDGAPYFNTHACYQDLNKASADARHLGLIDPHDLVDRRNPEPLKRRQQPKVAGYLISSPSSCNATKTGA